MLSKNKIKLVRSLEHRKYRQSHGLFVAEGPKVVGDLMLSFTCRYVCCLKEWLHSGVVLPLGVECDVVSPEELSKVSFQEHPQQVLALFELPARENAVSIPDFEGQTADSLFLALDGVQNPGNVGTIIRLADWFGISHLLCAQGTADVYNPKVVQATMGSLARVRIHEVDLPAFLRSLPSSVPVYGTFLDGENIYAGSLQPYGVIVMGNEGNGISPQVARCVSHRITIPNFNSDSHAADSLNVAVATAVVCSEFRRTAFQ